MIIPSESQIEKCAMFSWVYLGDGLFERDDVLGYFTDKGFYKT